MRTKIFSMMSSFLLAAGFAACSGSEDIPEMPQQPSQKQTYELKIGIGTGMTTRTSLDEQENANTSPWLWTDNTEKLVLTDKNGNKLCILDLKEILDDKNLAIFTGVSTERISTEDKYRLTYMGYGNNTLSSDGKSFSIDFEAQDGTVSKTGLGKCDAMYSDFKFKKDVDQVYVNAENVILSKLLTVVHFQLNDNESVKGAATNTQICVNKLSGTDTDGIYKKATITIGQAGGAKPTITPSDKATQSSPMTLNETADGLASGSLYLTMLPDYEMTPIFKRTYGTGDNATFAYGTPGKTDKLESGKLYRDQISGSTAGIPVEMKYKSIAELELVRVNNWTASGDVTIEN